MVHDRLLRLLQDAAAGSPPPADGLVEVWPPPPGAVDAVLAFTAHHVVAARVDPGNVASLRVVGAAGFRPVGAEVLFHRAGASPG